MLENLEKIDFRHHIVIRRLLPAVEDMLLHFVVGLSCLCIYRFFLSVGDTVFSPPTTDARLTIQFISLPTFHLEVRRILVFLIKLPSFLKRIFHIYHFLEKKHFYKKNLVVKRISSLSTTNQITKTASYEAVFVALL